MFWQPLLLISSKILISLFQITLETFIHKIYYIERHSRSYNPSDSLSCKNAVGSALASNRSYKLGICILNFCYDFERRMKRIHTYEFIKFENPGLNICYVWGSCHKYYNGHLLLGEYFQLNSAMRYQEKSVRCYISFSIIPVDHF